MMDTEFFAFSSSLRRLGQSFNRGTLHAELVTDYFADLKGYSLVIVDQAIGNVRRTSKFFPRPAQLLDACLEIAKKSSGHILGLPAPQYDAQGIPIAVYACSVCMDTGFERGIGPQGVRDGRALDCNGMGFCHIKGCGHGQGDTSPLEPHTFTRLCSCRATNPVLMKARADMTRPTDGGHS